MNCGDCVSRPYRVPVEPRPKPGARLWRVCLSEVPTSSSRRVLGEKCYSDPLSSNTTVAPASVPRGGGRPQASSHGHRDLGRPSNKGPPVVRLSFLPPVHGRGQPWSMGVTYLPDRTRLACEPQQGDVAGGHRGAGTMSRTWWTKHDISEVPVTEEQNGSVRGDSVPRRGSLGNRPVPKAPEIPETSCPRAGGADLVKFR